QLMSDGGPQVVAYVLGTAQDPQRLGAQRDAFVQAGCIVTETAARASLAAAAVATGNAGLVRARLGVRTARWSRTRPSHGAAWCIPSRSPRRCRRAGWTCW